MLVLRLFTELEGEVLKRLHEALGALQDVTFASEWEEVWERIKDLDGRSSSCSPSYLASLLPCFPMSHLHSLPSLFFSLSAYPRV